MRLVRGAVALLPAAAAACSLLAPTDLDLMGEASDASAKREASDEASSDASGIGDAPPSDSGGGLDDARNDAAEAGPPSPPCQACARLTAACKANPACPCLTADLCGGTSSCGGAGDQLTVSCSGTTCTTSSGKIVCLVGSETCGCN